MLTTCSFVHFMCLGHQNVLLLSRYMQIHACVKWAPLYTTHINSFLTAFVESSEAGGGHLKQSRGFARVFSLVVSSRLLVPKSFGVQKLEVTTGRPGFHRSLSFVDSGRLWFPLSSLADRCFRRHLQQTGVSFIIFSRPVFP